MGTPDKFVVANRLGQMLTYTFDREYLTVDQFLKIRDICKEDEFHWPHTGPEFFKKLPYDRSTLHREPIVFVYETADDVAHMVEIDTRGTIIRHFSI